MAPDDAVEILRKLDEHGRDLKELKGTAVDVLAEQKKTNGRVTALETENEVQERLRQERAEILENHRRKWEFVRPAVASMVGGVVVGLVLLVASQFT